MSFKLRLDLILALSLLANMALAQAKNEQTKTAKINSVVESWNFFRGPNFDGISPSASVADSWDQKGPPILWTIELGQGYSGFVGADDRLYTQYQSLTGQYVACLDAKTGDKVWEHRYGWPYKPASLYPGPRSTPTIHGNRVFYTSPLGEVGCLELRTGNRVWHVDLAKRFEAPSVEFGYSCSPVVCKDKLILPVGGKGAAVVALDPTTGKTIWTAGNYKVSYCSAYPIQLEGHDLVIGYFTNEIACFDLETGEELGNFPVSNGYDEHSAWPIYREPHLWISGPFRAGCRLFELKRVKNRVRFEPVYKKEEMSNDVASCVLHGNSLFGFDIRDVQSKVHRPSRGRFCCIDFMSGEVRWQNGSLGRRRTPEKDEVISSATQTAETDIGHASVIVAKNKLVMLNDTGTLIIADANATEYRELGRWSILGGEIIWTAPTLLNGRVFARNHSRAVCVYVDDLANLDRFDDSETLNFAAETEQPVFLDLAAVVLGTEPKYAMTAPSLKWLIQWFSISLLLGWVAAPAVAFGLSRLVPIVSVRTVFLTLAFAVGVFGTTVAGRSLGFFYFSWPIALAVVLECLVCQMKSRDENVKSNAILARAILLAFLAVNFAYFWLCRKLSLTFEWSFMMGFPAALPFLWFVKSSVQRQEPFSTRQWLLSAIAFAALYWTGAGVIIWLYGI